MLTLFLSLIVLAQSGPAPTPIGDGVEAEIELPQGTVIDQPPPATAILIDVPDTWALVHRSTLEQGILWRDEAAAAKSDEGSILLWDALPWLIAGGVAVAGTLFAVGVVVGWEMARPR